MTRSPALLPLGQAQPPLFAGVDLGGTNIKVGLVDDLGRPLVRHATATRHELGPEEGARRMGEAVREAIRQVGITPDQVARVGLGTPGTMDIPSGMLLEPPNLPGWEQFPIRERVSHHCGGLPVSFTNDANAAAYGEYWVGSGRQLGTMVLLTLGTGVGGGIIIHDATIEGEHSHGAECGHIIIDHRPDARLCPCGQTGHLEAYASATALVKRAYEALSAGRQSTLAGCDAAGEEITALVIAREAEDGDPLALELVLDTAMYLGVGITSLMHTIDPSGVVLGGAMSFGGHDSPLGRQFLERVQLEVRHRAFPVLAEKTVIDFASLGGDAGFIGAAGIARWEYCNRSTAAKDRKRTREAPKPG
jgi:glucokinase